MFTLYLLAEDGSCERKAKNARHVCSTPSLMLSLLPEGEQKIFLARLSFMDVTGEFLIDIRMARIHILLGTDNTKGHGSFLKERIHKLSIRCSIYADIASRCIHGQVPWFSSSARYGISRFRCSAYSANPQADQTISLCDPRPLATSCSSPR